jgi:hypothetical protein
MRDQADTDGSAVGSGEGDVEIKNLQGPRATMETVPLGSSRRISSIFSQAGLEEISR